MKKIIIPCCLVVLLLMCVATVAGGFTIYNAFKDGDFSKLGFMSFLSGKQEDLGVKFSETDATNFLNTNKLITTNTCPADLKCIPGGPTFSGTKKVDVVLSNAEGTALINQWIKLSKNAPFTTAQMRVNADGSVNFAGTVDLNRLKNFASANRVPESTTNMAMKFIGALGDSFPITASGTLTVKNDKVNANFSNFKVGFIPLPDAILKDQKVPINIFIEERLDVVNGLSIEELSFANGKTTFKGTLPATIVFAK